MKKSLVSALTTALVVGAASTTFAAANPFSDVPSGHWAYDAVAQLAQDGVIDGYGDNTFQGDKNITRYEMAQMVAKAMAKSNTGKVSGADQALVEKLKAEFSDELNNLGVRVANLEKNADKVKMTGQMRYDYWSNRYENRANDTKFNHVLYRLYPTAEINDHWKVMARLQGVWDPKADTTTNMKLSYTYAEAQYPGFRGDFGKMPLYSESDEGLIMDGQFSGTQLFFGNKLKAVVSAGRQDMTADGYEVTCGSDADRGNAGDAKAALGRNDVADYASLQLMDSFGKLNAGVAYHYFKSADFAYFRGYDKKHKEDKAGIWTLGGRYAFDKNTSLAGYYGENSKADAYEKTGSVELDYKGASAANAGSWGAFVAYRHLGSNASFSPTYDDMWEDMKGYSFGGSYAPMKNVTAYASYTVGKSLLTDKDENILFGRLKFVW